MANTLLTPTVIAKEALMQLENNLVMGKLVHRDYKKEFVKVGDTVTVRKPVKFRATDGATLDLKNVIERSTSVVINNRKHVAFPMSSQELTLTIEEYSKRYIQPGMIVLANEVDRSVCNLYSDVYNLAGTRGTAPDAFEEVTPAARLLDEEAAPEPRNLVLNPKNAWGVAKALVGIYNSEKVKGAIEKGKIGEFSGFTVYKDQNIARHTVGTHAGTPVMNGTTAEGATQIVTDGWTAAKTVAKGDVFTIAGVYAVNPVSGVSTGQLRNFVCTELATADGSGDMTIKISPAIYSASATGDYLPYQTVDAVPADGAAITVKGTASTAYSENLAFHQNAFGLVMCPLIVPDSAAWGQMMSHNGYAVRVIKDYDVNNDIEICRLDIMWGVKTLYPELACRLTD